MAILEFDPVFLLYNVNWCHLSIFLVRAAHLNIVWWGKGSVWAEEEVQATCTLLFKNAL